MKTIHNFLLFIIVALLYSLLHCFVMGDINVMAWGVSDRFLLSFNALVFGGAAIAMTNVK